MPNQIDWTSLKKTIQECTIINSNVIQLWGDICSDNASIVSQKKCVGKTLFEFLLTYDYFYDANTVASCITLFKEENIKLIYQRHHSKCTELLKILCTDKMILLYEDHFTQIFKENLQEESEFNSLYRSVIFDLYKKMNLNEPPSNYMTELIFEFKFLTDPYLENFYQTIKNSVSMEKSNEIPKIHRFIELYTKYKEFLPLIYRLINEYYLEYVKYHVSLIEDLSGNSLIIVSEHYDNFKKFLASLPEKYIDYKYQDKNGNNILSYVSKLSFVSNQISGDFYCSFLKKAVNLPLHLKNNNNNTIFHTIAENNNEIFLEELLIYTNNYDYDLENILQTENCNGKNMFDTAIDKKNFNIISKVIDYMPAKSYAKLTNKIIEDITILELLPVTTKMQNIYLKCINYFMDYLFQLKNQILYDKSLYLETIKKVINLFKIASNELNKKLNYYFEWLVICIKIKETALFKIILSKYFSNEHDPKITLYLNQLGLVNEPILITAIIYENIYCVKALLAYNVDLFVCDKGGKNSVFASLETKNIHIIKIIRNHIQTKNKTIGILPTIDCFIELLEKNETYNLFSVYETIFKIVKTIESVASNIFYGKY